MDKKNFLDALASDAATPGGGGGSAYVGALGLSLSQMALTISAKSANEVNIPLFDELIRQIESLRQDLYDLIEGDADAFIPLANAYKLPKSEPGRSEEIQKGLITAAQAPLSMMRLNHQAILLHQEAMHLANKMIISDVATGVTISLSSLKGAYINVLVNTKSIKDDETKQKFEKEAKELLSAGEEIAAEVYTRILQLMG